MRRVLRSASALALFGFFLQLNLAHGQDEKKLLTTNGWGTLSGKVTLDGKIPETVVPKTMLDHTDKACCLDPKATAIEKIDSTWIVDPKTKAVANVVIWIKAPPKTYFPLPPNYKPTKEPLVIDQPHCAFLPRVSAYNPINIIDGKEVETGQKVLIKNSAVVPHNIRATGSPDKNPGFNNNLPPKTDIEKAFVPQKLPVSLQCDVHTWMGAKLFVFDHPYYAISKADGSFAIPNVPAGAEVTLMAWHEGIGYVLTNKGKAVTFKTGENVENMTVKAP